MEYLYDAIPLGVDLIILGFCVREYYNCKRNISNLNKATELPIDGNLVKYVEQQKDKRVPYVALRGTVTPIGVPLRSVLSPSVTSVIQIIKLSEHRIARGIAGFWTDQHKVIHVAYNEMPFEISSNGQSVEVMNALSAAVLDLDVVYDKYEPSSLSLFNNLSGFISGVKTKGLQTTEEVLRDGSFITAIGELELDGDKLRLQASTEGPLFLTTATKHALVKRFQDAKMTSIFRIVLFGSIATFMIGYMARKFYLKKKQERDERRIKEALDKERRTRRAKSRPSNLPLEQLCVVCTINPREIIVLPCGHVCLCEDCSEKIKYTCPVCRSHIGSRAAAFIS